MRTLEILELAQLDAVTGGCGVAQKVEVRAVDVGRPMVETRRPGGSVIGFPTAIDVASQRPTSLDLAGGGAPPEVDTAGPAMTTDVDAGNAPDFDVRAVGVGDLIGNGGNGGFDVP